MQNGYMKNGASPKLGHLPVLMVQIGDADATLATYGLYNGTRAQGLAAIKPLLGVGSPTLALDQSGSYMKLNEILLPNPNLPPHVTSFPDRKSTRLNSSHLGISYAVFCLKKK